jgi:hypothetical protein
MMAVDTFLDPSDTTQTGGSGAKNVPRLLPAYKTKTPSTDGNYDDEYEVPHVVNTTGSTSGGRGGISAAYGGRRGRGDLGTRKMLRERGVMGGIRDPAEERLGRGGKKQKSKYFIKWDYEYYNRQIPS